MAILTTMILGLLVGTLSKVAADEVKAWLPSLSLWLLRLAISSLPESERERFREEWQADLLTYPGQIVRCFRAAGLYIASLRIRWYARKSLIAIVLERVFWRLVRLYLWTVAWRFKLLTKQLHGLKAAEGLVAAQVESGEPTAKGDPDESIREE